MVHVETLAARTVANQGSFGFEQVMQGTPGPQDSITYTVTRPLPGHEGWHVHFSGTPCTETVIYKIPASSLGQLPVANPQPAPKLLDITFPTITDLPDYSARQDQLRPTVTPRQ